MIQKIKSIRIFLIFLIDDMKLDIIVIFGQKLLNQIFFQNLVKIEYLIKLQLTNSIIQSYLNEAVKLP